MLKEKKKKKKNRLRERAKQSLYSALIIRKLENLTIGVPQSSQATHTH